MLFPFTMGRPRLQRISTAGPIGPVEAHPCLPEASPSAKPLEYFACFLIQYGTKAILLWRLGKIGERHA
jgi:hypothetical protein